MSFADTLGGAAAFLNLGEGAKGTTTLGSQTQLVGAAPEGAVLIGDLYPSSSRPPDAGLADAHRNHGKTSRRDVTQTQMTL